MSRQTSAQAAQITLQMQAEEAAQRAKLAMQNLPATNIYEPQPIEKDPRFKELLREYKRKCPVEFVEQAECAASLAQLCLTFFPTSV
jgi:hypothetical protein